MGTDVAGTWRYTKNLQQAVSCSVLLPESFTPRDHGIRGACPFGTQMLGILQRPLTRPVSAGKASIQDVSTGWRYALVTLED